MDRRAPLLAALLLALPLTTGCADDDVPAGRTTAVEPAPHRTAFETVTVRIELADVEPASSAGLRAETVSLGTEVEIVAPPELVGRMHVRGFEVFSDPSSPEPGLLRFLADDAGSVLVEAEETGTQLLRLDVLPGHQ